MRPEHQAWERLQLLRSQLKAYFKQREDFVDGALVALLAGVHLLVLGPPGTAKTMLAETLCRQITGARYFYYLLNKFTTWKDLACGPTTVREAEDNGGRSISFRNSEGALLGAHLAVLDEVFKAAGVTLNATLQLLGPARACSINAGEVLPVPLLSAFGASNEMPTGTDDQLRAFADRFVLRFEVHYINVSQDGDTDFVDMLAGRQRLPDATVSLEEILYFQREVERIPIGEMILGLINSLRATLVLEHGIQPSDRRYRDSRKVLQAFAFLNGHAQVEVEDLRVLEHVLWTSREERERDTIRKVVAEVARTPQVARAMALMREADALHREAVDHLHRAAAVMPFDERTRAAQNGDLGDAYQRERRLDQIHEALVVIQQDADAMALATVRTYCNQVNVLRKHLVGMRTIENPFAEATL